MDALYDRKFGLTVGTSPVLRTEPSSIVTLNQGRLSPSLRSAPSGILSLMQADIVSNITPMTVSLNLFQFIYG